MNLTNFRIIIILLILMGAVIVGYTKSSRLNEVELVSGLGIDKVDDQYSITLQVFNPAANQKNAVDPTGGFTYIQTGRTIPEALMKIKRNTLKEAILDTIQVVIVSEKLAKEEGLNEALDFLVRDPRIPAHINTVLIKNQSPEVFFKLFTPQQKLSSLYTKTMVENSKSSWGNLVNTSSERIKSLLEDKTSDVVIPYVEVHGDIQEGISKRNIEDFAPATIISLEGLASFKGEKLHSFLTFEESNILALIKGIDQTVSISTPCPDGDDHFTIDTIQTSSSLSTLKDPLSYQLKVSIEGNLEESTCSRDLLSQSTKADLERTMEAKVKADIEALIKKVREDGTDIIGLRDALFREKPAAWKEKQKDEDFFSSADIRTSVDVTFIRFGHTKH
ncbi:Ger(x)C family spore germination protein [Bacillus sp. V3]|nr:Ger(x)C family spore germination protein [Bacillus sp. V3]